ncbi:transposase [Kitasatospora sp. NPDC088346]|uniref:transposase n=1 Tax=Kitasatospora sp. NPDC088346 TaxID=3364073 RepID=UPI0037F5DCBC
MRRFHRVVLADQDRHRDVRVRTGVPWRDVPVEYGPWSRVYDLFRRWQRNRTWQRILTRLQSLADAKGAVVWELSVDSTVCRAHQHAARARKQGDLQKEPPGGVFAEPRDHGRGRREAGSPPSCTWQSSRDRSPCRSWSRQDSAGTRRSSNPCWQRSACPVSGRAGHGLCLPQEPRLPAPPRDPLHHPGQGRPGRQPQETRLPRRPPAEVRPAGPQGSACG